MKPIYLHWLLNGILDRYSYLVTTQPHVILISPRPLLAGRIPESRNVIYVPLRESGISPAKRVLPVTDSVACWNDSVPEWRHNLIYYTRTF
jgi:hypothetical protein